MTRALGHITLSKYGVSPEPEFMSMEMTADTEYIFVAGSDGLWDVVTEEEAGQIVHENLVSQIHANDSSSTVEEEICRELVSVSELRWQRKLVGDNISVLVFRCRK